MPTMKWPGTQDPRKRKQTIRFLIITAIIGVSVAVAASTVNSILSANDPLKVCINDRHTPYRITANLDLWVDGSRAEIPANIGFNEGQLADCQRSMYTLSNDGTIYAEWEEEYGFEVGHFLWMWGFPIRDMVEAESVIYKDGIESPEFIRTLLEDGSQYRAEFTSKEHEQTRDQDFMPPARDE